MSEIFKYERLVKTIYLERSDEYEDITDDVYYKVEDDELLSAVTSLVCEEYFERNKDDLEFANNLRNFIRDSEMLDDLVEKYYDDIKEMFEEEALDSYE